LRELFSRFIYWFKNNFVLWSIAAGWAAAIYANGAWGTHFDVNAIWQGMLAWIAKRGIDKAAEAKNYKTASEFNSECGVEPKAEEGKK